MDGTLKPFGELGFFYFPLRIIGNGTFLFKAKLGNLGGPHCRVGKTKRKIWTKNWEGDSLPINFIKNPMKKNLRILGLKTIRFIIGFLVLSRALAKQEKTSPSNKARWLFRKKSTVGMGAIWWEIRKGKIYGFFGSESLFKIIFAGTPRFTLGSIRFGEGSSKNLKRNPFFPFKRLGIMKKKKGLN